MYIIECFIKWINKNKRGSGANPNNGYQEGVYLDSDGEKINEPIDESKNCQHNYMPVDSTGNILACTKCGFVVKKNIRTKKEK